MTSTIRKPTQHAQVWTGIDAAAYHFPGERQDIEAWALQHNLPDNRVQAIIRAGCRHFHAAPDTDEVALAVRLFDGVEDARPVVGHVQSTRRPAVRSA